ncbi:hypothetical protein V5O48_008497 [Marasmius crinis-equi]|uniref:F-box domain-containing protein n=1 Tax=Marasmius crinis-equi TaxID=585013 RepID=A0ABR3FED9_9AGAR
MVNLAEQNEVLLDAMQQTTRIASLDLYSRSLDVAILLDIAWSRMNAPAPLLHTIQISCHCGLDGSFFTELPDTFLAGNAPRLTNLVLTGCSISWRSLLLKNLTCLSLKHPNSRTAVRTVFDALTNLPLLVALELRHCISPTSPSDFPSQTTLDFPRLRRMILSIENLPCLSLIQRMSFPNTTAIRLMCYDPDPLGFFPVHQLFAYTSRFLAPATTLPDHPRAIRGLGLTEGFGLSLIARNNDNSDLQWSEPRNLSEDFLDGELPHLQLDIWSQHFRRADIIRSLLGLVPLVHLESLRINCAAPLPPESLSQALERSRLLKSVCLQDQVSSSSLELLSNTFLYPALMRLALVGVNFKIEPRSALLQALVDGLKHRARNGCPLKEIALTGCVGLEEGDVREVWEALCLGLQRQEDSLV